VLGASTEPSMVGRAQVILIVTGLGGPVSPGPRRASPKDEASQPVREVPDDRPADLDLPTFLRRRLDVDQEATHG
jgi:hypothetical protein